METALCLFENRFSCLSSPQNGTSCSCDKVLENRIAVAMNILKPNSLASPVEHAAAAEFLDSSGARDYLGKMRRNFNDTDDEEWQRFLLYFFGWIFVWRVSPEERKEFRALLVSASFYDLR